MANPSEDDLPAPEEEGGPVKSFLEHLEDLRWTLVKCISTVIVGVIVCLLAGKYLVAFMVWPLHQAERQYQNFRAPPPEVPVLLGTNVMGQVDWRGLELPGIGTNHVTAVRLAPVVAGTNVVLALEAETASRPPVRQTLVVLKNYSPIEGVLVALRLAIYGGLVLTAPIVFFFVGQFVLPALRVVEKRILYKAVGFGTGLFFLGVVFCYFLVSVIALLATVQFSQWLGFTADEWRAEAYIGFLSKLMLGMGLAFQLPVVVLTLVKVGVLEYEQLRRFRVYAVVGNLVLAAFFTPPDPFTMLALAIPLYLLYEMSVFIAGVWARRAAREAAAAEQAV